MDLTELKNLNFDIKSRHPWERARLQIIIHFLKSIIRKTGNPGPVIFDIGSGDAFVAFNVASTFPGCRVHAIDTAFNDNIKGEIRKQTDKVSILLYDNIEKITLEPGRKADIILLLDVIEHIEDDAGFLSSLVNHPLISEDTWFILTAPAYPCLFSSHDKFLNHYRRYTRKSLNCILNKTGLKSLKSGYFFFVLLFPRVFRYTMEKLKLVNSAEKGIGQWKQRGGISRILYAILLNDFFICRIISTTGIIFPGLSVFNLCKPAR
jgi:hypothetical protein